MRYLLMLLKTLLIILIINNLAGCCWFKKCPPDPHLETNRACASVSIPSDADTAADNITQLDKDRDLDAIYATSICYNKAFDKDGTLLSKAISTKPSVLLPVTLAHLAKFDGAIFSSLHLSSNSSNEHVIYAYGLLQKAWQDCDKTQVNAFAKATYSVSVINPVINCDPLYILSRGIEKKNYSR